jgi:hypothetical protein
VLNSAVAPTLLVDAENVRRSAWPNLGRSEVLARSREWARRQGVTLLVVFDGDPPEAAADAAGSGAGSADDRIVELAATVERPLWVATSDRELRERIDPPAERAIGGGTFLRQLEEIERPEVG